MQRYDIDIIKDALKLVKKNNTSPKYCLKQIIFKILKLN